MKLRKLHIEDYKMFKDFDISFVDENDEALPIVVLAGVNGSGKTTLFEFIKSCEYEYYGDNDSLNFLITDRDKKISDKPSPIESPIYFQDDKLSYFNDIKNTLIPYLPAGSDKIENIKETIRQKYIDRAFEIDKPSEALAELEYYIKDIFDGLDLTFNLSTINYNKEEVLFQDNSGNEFDIDELSTGEKTLLSKILYLYFKDYKDKVILIDEPELSLHPSWQNRVLKIYENFALQNNCQIIIATHSPHIIGSAKAKYIRVLKKIDDKIEVAKYTQSYGLEFNKILTDIMGADTRVSEVSDRLSEIKSMIVQEKFDSEEFQKIWTELEKFIGVDNIDLRLLKLEIASRKKNAQNK